MTPSTGLLASRYRILRELGRGGMGVVYLVEHVHTGDHLALKLLLENRGANAEVIERFKREARAPARIKSEHVVKVTDADVAPEMEGAPFLVMELLEGSDLEKELARRTRFAPAEVVWIFRQLASALDKAHALGITHRDLKPENVFLHRRESGESIVKILDFGISKLAGEGVNDIASAGLTKSGAMMGTPLYMSPEQARGITALVGPPTDIWALGLIAYRLLTGRLYWQANTLAELMVQILGEPMPAPSSRAPELPAAFDAWFACSCDRDPARRFRTVGEQVAALASVLAVDHDGLANAATLLAPAPNPAARAPDVAALGVQTTAGPLAQSAIASPPTRSRRGAWIAAVLGALALAGAIVGVQLGRGASSTRAAAASIEPEPAAPKARGSGGASAAVGSPARGDDGEGSPSSEPSRAPAAVPATASALAAASSAPVRGLKTTSAPKASSSPALAPSSTPPQATAEAKTKPPRYEPAAP